jgi:phosphoribosyl-ATP pyrophosphohydrolase/phosphoribosyl-AMP cyclohydrolase
MAGMAETLEVLDEVIAARDRERPAGSYTSGLFAAGVPRIAQKVGEEGVETALAAVVGGDRALLSESADLLFHLAVLLRARGLSLREAVGELAARLPRAGPEPPAGRDAGAD